MLERKRNKQKKTNLDFTCTTDKFKYVMCKRIIKITNLTKYKI